MHRIDGGGHVGNMFVTEDAGLNRPPTEVTDDWLNAVQEEISGVILSSGIALNKADNTQLSQALGKLFDYANKPFQALDYPTIDTADNKLTVTPLSGAGTGGTVSIPAGVSIVLAETVSAGIGRQRVMTTANWESAKLDINSTYYLRAQIVNGALLVYVQKGTDADAIPGSQIGIPNGAAGGGFDSTAVDMLIAKVVMGVAGSVPTVTGLKNKRRLAVWGLHTGTATGMGSGGWTYDMSVSINWARSPSLFTASGAEGGLDSTEQIENETRMNSLVATRYALACNCAGDRSGAGLPTPSMYIPYCASA